MKHLDYLKLLTNPLAGGSGGGGSSPTGTVDIVANGTANVAAYAEANVAVPGGLYNGQAFDPIPANAIIAQALTTRRDTELAGMHPGQTNVHSGNVSLDLTITRGDYLIVTGTTTPSGKSFVLAGVVTSVNQFPNYQYARMTLRFVIIDDAGKLTITSPGWYDLRGYELAEVSGGGGGGEETLRGLLDGSLTGTLSDSTITFLRAYAFYHFTALAGVSFPEVTLMDGYAFEGCTSLTDVYLPKVTTIPASTFYGCTVLRDTVFPLVTKIKSAAFQNCVALTKVNSTYFPSLSQGKSDVMDGGSIFAGCDHLTEVDLPSAVDALPAYTFKECTRLASVTFRGTEFSGSSVFQSCRALETALFPNLTTIGNGSIFRDCISLQNIEFPALTYINSGGNYIFRGCTALTKVIFHAQLNCVPAYTFQSCSSLKYVLFAGATAVIQLNGSNAFQDTPIASGTGYIYVPDALLTTWKAASNWATYANQIKGIKAWTPEAHDVDDIVTSQGHYYLCIASTASTPWMGPGETAYWQDFGAVV